MSLISYTRRSARTREINFSLHPGQIRSLEATKRTVLVLAGTQGGKTTIGPLWLFREMQRKGPGDYLVACPSFDLMAKRATPEFERLFERELKLGKLYRGGARAFIMNPRNHSRVWGNRFLDQADEPTRVLFGHAKNPDSLESATIKAVWMDEAGQKAFKIASYEAIQRRLSIHNGRQLITTTPYNLGWLKTVLHDPGVRGDPDIDLVRFESIMNPTFSREVWDRAQRTLPRWKFDLFYRAIFTRPAGLIYDSFDDNDVVTPFKIPEDWPRYIGIDFGGVNLACIFYAWEPGGELFAYREYYPQEHRSVEQHTIAMLKGEPRRPRTVGGAPSEIQWRREFGESGLGIERPRITEVEVGLDRVWAAHKARRIKVFNTLSHYLDEKRSYSRVLNDEDQPTDAIEDKHDYHLMDAERYIISEILAVESAESTTSMTPF